MKLRNLLLFPILFSLSCSVKPTVTVTEKASFTVNYSYVDEEHGVLTFSDGYLDRGFDNFSLPKTPLIAGDYFEIEYTGELLTIETFPCQYVIKNGEVLSTRFVPTSVETLKKDEITRWANIDIFSTRVILNQLGEWKYFNDYKGDVVYCTMDMGYYEQHKCPPNANCGVLPAVVAGVYAYNPRI